MVRKSVTVILIATAVATSMQLLGIFLPAPHNTGMLDVELRIASTPLLSLSNNAIGSPKSFSIVIWIEAVYHGPQMFCLTPFRPCLVIVSISCFVSPHCIEVSSAYSSY